MKFDDKDKNFGCFLIVAAIVASVAMGAVLDGGQRIIKKAIKKETKTEQPSDSAKLAKQKAQQILFQQKVIRSK